MNNKSKKNNFSTPWLAVISNFVGALFMVVSYFLSDNYWYLVAAVLFVAAGVGLIYLMKHVRKKFGQKA